MVQLIVVLVKYQVNVYTVFDAYAYLVSGDWRSHGVSRPK